MSMTQMYCVLNNVGMLVRGTECEYKKDAKIIVDAMNRNPDNKGVSYSMGILMQHTRLNE